MQTDRRWRDANAGVGKIQPARTNYSELNGIADVEPIKLTLFEHGFRLNSDHLIVCVAGQVFIVGHQKRWVADVSLDASVALISN